MCMVRPLAAEREHPCNAHMAQTRGYNSRSPEKMATSIFVWDALWQPKLTFRPYGQLKYDCNSQKAENRGYIPIARL